MAWAKDFGQPSLAIACIPLSTVVEVGRESYQPSSLSTLDLVSSSVCIPSNILFNMQWQLDYLLSGPIKLSTYATCNQPSVRVVQGYSLSLDEGHRVSIDKLSLAKPLAIVLLVGSSQQTLSRNRRLLHSNWDCKGSICTESIRLPCWILKASVDFPLPNWPNVRERAHNQIGQMIGKTLNLIGQMIGKALNQMGQMIGKCEYMIATFKNK